ncbi:PLP-dependent transferase [Gonapodya prolifera JEL478]|uniref:aspartate transaminase n=1 Tax=Gonapodya prolifera (strain JEL478) TaxID=1344416 RepID=A0A139ATN6_GONPJ|nr:PLP-dependent transferase [Gonapodya prolifera JEL478]|eukprot:KXS20079.1 PLP-dependent transferase [Gonapodya prolifera JEL478]
MSQAKPASRYESVPQPPGDAIFGIVKEFRASTHPSKVNLSIGAYRDDQGQPWVLPVVKKAELQLVQSPSYDHEYLGMEGYAPFVQAASLLVLGKDSKAIKEGRVAAVQTVSGTGAIRLAYEFYKNYRKDAPILLPRPTWPNHPQIAVEAGIKTLEYRYYDAKTKGLDLAGMLEDIKAAPPRSIILLHACAHNPTGVDPTPEQWKQIAEACLSRDLDVFFDIAYQGFASGDLGRDAWAVRHFEERGFELFVAQSFSKNFGLYGERTGALTCVVGSKETAAKVTAQLGRLTRALVSNCPSHGAKIAAVVLNDPALYAEWEDNLQTMSKRIQTMRDQVFDILTKELKTPGDWTHIKNQIGMFSYTGLTKAQCTALRKDRAVFLLDSGRISVAGLNEGNVRYFAESLDWAVRNVKE